MGFFGEYFLATDIAEDYKEKTNFWRGFMAKDYQVRSLELDLRIEKFAFIGLGNYLMTAVTFYALSEAVKTGELKPLLYACCSELFRCFGRILYNRNKTKDKIYREIRLQSERQRERELIDYFKEEGARSIEDAVLEAHQEALEYKEGEKWKGEVDSDWMDI